MTTRSPVADLHGNLKNERINHIIERFCYFLWETDYIKFAICYQQRSSAWIHQLAATFVFSQKVHTNICQSAYCTYDPILHLNLSYRGRIEANRELSPALSPWYRNSDICNCSSLSSCLLSGACKAWFVRVYKSVNKVCQNECQQPAKTHSANGKSIAITREGLPGDEISCPSECVQIIEWESVKE